MYFGSPACRPICLTKNTIPAIHKPHILVFAKAVRVSHQLARYSTPHSQNDRWPILLNGSRRPNVNSIPKRPELERFANHNSTTTSLYTIPMTQVAGNRGISMYRYTSSYLQYTSISMLIYIQIIVCDDLSKRECDVSVRRHHFGPDTTSSRRKSGGGRRRVYGLFWPLVLPSQYCRLLLFFFFYRAEWVKIEKTIRVYLSLTTQILFAIFLIAYFRILEYKTW